MVKNLIIVESPAKAKTIEKYLGKGFKVIATMGHIRDLPKSRLGIDIEDRFEPKYITIKGKSEIVKKIKSEAKNSKKVYLAADLDREGEAISWHLATILKISEDENCRITFNEITKSSIQNSIKNPRKINKNLVNAQQARRILDRIVGYKISPLLWKKIRKGLSAGRVQSVAMKIIIKRENEIENFKESEYWSISASVSKLNDKKTFTIKFHGQINGKKIALLNEDSVKQILGKITSNFCSVVRVKKSKKNKNPSPPFTTSTLQQESSRKLGFSSKRTMSVAQTLYDAGFITYMRTDSLRISKESQSEALEYIEKNFGKDYVPNKPNIYKSKKASQDAHEAIRPTSVMTDPDSIKSSFTPEKHKIYKLIWQRFLSSQMTQAKFDLVQADVKVDDYLFKASGQTMIFDGFTKIYVESQDAKESDDDEEKDDKDEKLPEIIENEELSLIKTFSKQHFTKPPSRFSEASLVKQMESEEIGRPSTYAPTMSVIVDREYVVKDKKNLVPTELGKVVNTLMEENFKDIVDVQFTANMESKLDEVEDGKKDWKEILEDFYKVFREDLEKAEEKIGKVEIKDEVSDVVCEKCGLIMVYKRSKYGRFLACPGYPNCKNAKSISKELGIKCIKCGGKILIKKSKKGKKYFICENASKCGFLSWDEPTGKKCPRCEETLLKKVASKKEKSIKIFCTNKDCGYEENMHHEIINENEEHED